MAHVLVIYASDYGHTEAAGEAVSRGAEGAGASVRTLAVGDATRQSVLDADAIVLGTPVHMGSVHWGIKRFIDDTLSGLWTRDLMVGRVGGVFATGGGIGGAGGGCELAMLSMLSTLAELGMVLVPLPKSSKSFPHGGLHWGPYARCGSDELTQAPLPATSMPLFTAHGRNIARVASILSSHSDRWAADAEYTRSHLDR